MQGIGHHGFLNKSRHRESCCVSTSSKPSSTAESALIIAPTAFAKKGKCSVGVARQWKGRLSKQDNCQLGITAMLCHGRFAAPVDFRLHLPRDWTENADRCIKAHVPEDRHTYRSSVEIALEMVKARPRHRL